MKQQQQRETAPVWVWLAVALMIVGALAYVTGYWVLEEIIAHLKR